MTGIEKRFDFVANEYDAQRRRLIPCFDDLYSLPLDYLQLQTDTPEVLDIGAGTGLFSAFVLEKYPHAQLTLIDLAEKMLEVAKKRFAGRIASYINADYTMYDFPQKFDVIISALSIHHLTAQDKEALYHKCYTWLKPGGIFLNIDQVLSRSANVEKLHETLRDEKLENAGLTEDEIAQAYERIRYDDPSPMEHQLQWLRDAGFADVDCIYKYSHFAVMYAKKD